MKKEDLDPQRWRRVRAAFEAALELAPAERAGWLQRELQGRPDLVAEVEAMLAAEPEAAGYLTPPGTVTMDAVAPSWLLGARPGDRLGPYELLRLIGSGGMGAVFEARREKPSRTVALKVMRAGLAGDVAHRRFLDEIEVLAKLQHPGIAAVFEAGAEGDLPWFAMELLEDAKPITEHAAARQLPLHARLDLVLQVADAVQHAHQRGVIHRDLKPANILVDATGRAKVIDFGIARSLTRDLEQLTTASPGALLGTLLYMSPERLADRSDAADVRSDVYGLGVVLYELLAHRRPFAIAGRSLAEACRTILDQEPAAPSSFAPEVPRELDWIVQRALAKERERRYATVAEFAADLRRFRRHEPVLAAPPSTGYRLRKFVRRNRAGVAAAGVVLAVTIGSFAAITSALWRARDAETAERERAEEATQSRKETETALLEATANKRQAEAALEFLLDVFETASPNKTSKGKDVTMADALDRAAKNLEQRLTTEPALRAALGHTVGVAYGGLGNGELAAQYIRDAISLQEQIGDDPSFLGEMLVDLASILAQRGGITEAESMLQRAESLLAAAPETKARLLARVLAGNLMRMRGKRTEARAVLTDTLAQLQRRFGPEDRDTLLAMNLLGGVVHELGDVAAAEPLYHSAMLGLGKVKGEDHPDTLTARFNLAIARFTPRAPDESLAMIQQVLGKREALLGQAHPDTIVTMIALGGLHYMLRRVDQAMEVWTAAYERSPEDMRREDPRMQTLILNLATGERDRGNYERAVRLNEEVLAIRRVSLGPSHSQTLVAHSMLGDILMRAGKAEQAAEQFDSCLALAQGREPPDPVAVYRCHMGRGRLAREAGRYAEAERELLACRDGFAAAYASIPVKSLLTRCEPDLVQLYEQWGKPELAAPFREAIEAAAKAPAARPGADK